MLLVSTPLKCKGVGKALHSQPHNLHQNADRESLDSSALLLCIDWTKCVSLGHLQKLYPKCAIDFLIPIIAPETSPGSVRD